MAAQFPAERFPAGAVEGDRFAATPLLTGDRVRLEPLSATHRDDLASASAEGELWRTWYTPIPAPEQMSAEIDRRLALQRAGTMAPWAVVVPGPAVEDPWRAVGMTTYMNVDPENRRLEIGSTWLGRATQGCGVNPATKLLLLTRAFDELGCVAVEFRTHWHNRQSRAAIARLGAKQDGVLRNHRLMTVPGVAEPVLRDTVVFSIIAAEWPTVRLGLRERIARRG